MKTAVLVGQAPTRGFEGRVPFCGTVSGRRLAVMAGIKHDALPEFFVLMNVLNRWPGKAGKGDAFPIREARAAALEMVIPPGLPVIFVGASARAFRFNGPALEWRELRSTRAAYLPHPSGVNSWYNDGENMSATVRFLGALMAGERA